MSSVSHFTAADGIRVTVVDEAYFKKDRLSINILLPLKKGTAAANALLAGLLSHSSEEYPDLLSLNRRLADLYGAKLASLVFKIGEIQVLRLSITSMKGKFTENNESIAEDCLEFILSLLLKPLVQNCTFSAKDTEIERRNLIDLIESSINDKRAYANERLVAEMCKNEAYGVKETGDVASVNEVTAESLYYTWERIIKTARIEIFAVGEMEGDKLANTVKAAFSHINRNPEPFPLTNVIADVEKIKTVEEEMNVEQAKLAIGLRTGITNTHPDHLALTYANAIFGSGVSSKLFTVVREQMHLCYYCSSRLDMSKGLMLIQSGIDKANYSKALKAITDQLNSVKQDDFTDEDMSAALLSLQNSYRTVNDDPAAIENWYLRGVISGNDRSPEEAAEQIAEVTREDIVRAISNVTVDTVYLLKGRESK